MRLNLSFLGAFRARFEAGSAVEFQRRKVEALVAYLGVRRGQPTLRGTLATLLWGDLSENQARHNLRQALFVLRRSLDREVPGALIVEGDAVALDPTCLDVDVVRFEDAARDGSPEALARAQSLYQGEFLEGFAVGGAGFEDWLRAERDRLHEVALEVGARLLAHQMASEHAEPAIQTALKLLTLDPLQEVVHRTLMRLYMRQGRRAAALHEYQLCIDVLQRELGSEPEEATRALYEQILPKRTASVAAAGADAQPAGLARRARGADRRRRRASFETPLIGRDAEIEIVRRVFREVSRGRGAVLIVTGEAGIGKTRLVTEVEALAHHRNGLVLAGRAFESAQALPFGPWVDALRSDPRVSSEATTIAPMWQVELARLLPELGPDEPAGASRDALRLFQAVGHLLAGLAARQPLVITLEDLQWADEMTLRLVAFIGRQIERSPILVVATAREEEIVDAELPARTLEELRRHPWSITRALLPLSRPEMDALVRSLGGVYRDPARVERVEEHVWRVSEGNPFMAVETMRHLADRADPADPLALLLPERIRDVVAARLGRLSEPGRRLVEIASVIGREFDFALVQRAAALDDRDAARAVEELVRRRVLRGAGERLDFTHDRIREVAESQLVAPQRKLLDRLVGAAYEAVYAEDLEPHVVALSTHYLRGEVWDKAVAYLRWAGVQATERSALAQSVEFLEQAIAALPRLPDTHETRTLAFDIRLELRPALTQLGEGRRLLARLREAETLAERLNDDRRRARVGVATTLVCALRGELDEAIVAGTRALEVAGRLGDLRLRIHATTALDLAHYYRGDYERVVQLCLDNIAALPANWVHEYLGNILPPSVHDRCWLAYSLVELGRFSEADRYQAEALRIAEATHHVHTIGQARRAASLIPLLQGDWARARPLIEQWIAGLRTVNIAAMLPAAVSSAAWVLAELGETSDARDRLREGEQLIEYCAARGVFNIRGWNYHALGRACFALGQLDEARRLAT